MPLSPPQALRSISADNNLRKRYWAALMCPASRVISLPRSPSSAGINEGGMMRLETGPSIKIEEGGMLVMVWVSLWICGSPIVLNTDYLYSIIALSHC